MPKLLLLLLTLPLAAAPIVDETFTGALPFGWSAALTGSGDGWYVPTGQTGVRAQPGPYSLATLVSPAFTIGQFPVTLTLEYGILTGNGNAGMALEYTINDGVYADVAGNFTQGGYDGTVTNADPNPVLGPFTSRPVWANGGGTSVLQLDPGAFPANSTIRFRFLLGTSFSGAQDGLSRFTLADAAPGEPNPVPEPATILLTALPLAALALRRKLPLLLLALLTLSLSAGTIVDQTFDLPNGNLPPDWFSFLDLGSGTPWTVQPGNDTARTEIAPNTTSYLFSPTFTVPNFPVTLTVNLGVQSVTSTGLVLEYSLNNGAYTDVSSLAQFLSFPYNGVLTTADGNPLLNGGTSRPAWTGGSGTATLVFDPQPLTTPATLKFRFIYGSGTRGGIAGLSSFTLEAADPEVPPTHAPVPEPSTFLLTAATLAVLLRKLR